MTATEKQIMYDEAMKFYCDLTEYQVSKQGKRLDAALRSGSVAEVQRAAADYYKARNGRSLEYDSEDERQEAIKRDKQFAELYHEQD